MLMCWLIGIIGKAETERRMKARERVGWTMLVFALKILIPLVIGWGCLYFLKVSGEKHFSKQRLQYLYVGLVSLVAAPMLYVWREQIIDFLI